MNKPLLALPALLALILTACGSNGTTTGGASAPSAEPTTTATAPTGASGAGTTYPVTVQNCGRSVTFDEAPTRIVSGWSTATELLLDLGAGDRVVGQYNTASSGPSAEHAADYAKVPVLAESAPSKESLLAAAPDLIYADGSYLFDGEQLPTVDDLAESGTQVLVLSGFCEDGGSSKVTDVKDDLAALGPALDASGPAEKLAGTVDARLQAVADETEAAQDVPMAVVGSYDGALYVYDGVYTDIVDRAGGTNAFAGTLPAGKFFGELSAEQLTAEDPGTLLYLTAVGESEQDAQAYLDEAFPTVAAVKDDRVLFLPQEESSNLRGIDGLEAVAQGLAGLG